MIEIIDDFLDIKDYDGLNELHTEYASVHWHGANCSPKNALHKLISSTEPYSDSRANRFLSNYDSKKKLSGATAWYNIRPIDPQWHNDIDSYCTQNGITQLPEVLPKYTFLYYMRSPNSGGELELETGDLIQPVTNRLVKFPCVIRHRVRPYAGNRVSVGIIWWFDIPKIYGDLSEKDTKVLPRVWEIEDKRSAVWT